MNKKSLLYVAAFTAVLAMIFYFLSFPSLTTFKNSTEKKLNVLDQKALQDLDSIHYHLNHYPKLDFVNYLSGTYETTFQNEGIAYFIYENDSLQYWTDSHPAVENYMLNVCLEKQVVKLKNGYYQVIRHSQNAYSSVQLYALVLLKNNFAYQNKYLRNGFNKNLYMPLTSEFEDVPQSDKNSFSVVDAKNNFLFAIQLKEQVRNETYSYFSFFLLCISLFSFLYFFKKKLSKSSFYFLGWGALVILSTSLIYLFLFKLNGLYETKLDEGTLQPIFTILILLLIIWIFSIVRNFSSHLNEKKYTSLLFIISICILYFFGFGINLYFKTVFSKPILAADLADVFFYPSAQIYLSYACVFLILFCFSILCEAFSKFFYDAISSKNHLIQFVAISICNLFLQHFLGQYDVLTVIWPGLFFVVVYFSKRNISTNKFLYGIIICLIISFFGAYLTIDLKNKTDYKQRLELAKELVDPKDEIAENLFQNVKTTILKDKELERIVLKKDKNTTLNAEQYVLRKYFMGYWERYHISVCFFDSLCTPLVQQPIHLYNNNTYFDEIISSKLKPTSCAGLYFNNLLKDKTFYLYKADLPITHKPYEMYVVVESKKTHDYQGFPDLLLNQSLQTINTEYSYAIYRNNQLQNKQGSYEYTSSLHNIGNVDHYNENGYNHFVYRSNGSSVVIVSKNYKYINDLFATISFLFLAGSTLFLVLSIIDSSFFRKENSLAIKIQYYVSVGVLVLFVPVAINAFTLAKKQTEAQNVSGIKDKIQVVSNYLSNQLAGYDTLASHDKDYVSYILRQASTLFKSDITLFYPNGEYYTAGLSKLFDEGIISKKINPVVYASTFNTDIEQEVYNEHIGRLQFYSAYRTINNAKQHNLAIINTPYFSKQNELQAQLFGYLSALFNIYVLSFMLISIATALLANWLTRPLQQLQVQIKRLALNKNNEPIKYSKTDEVGMLIAEYNNMLIKLEHSANQLTKSEREGAWKEMARQVAHEIKNPLTPMKLSIQHVQRLMETDKELAYDQIKKITPILLEQIDSLAHIATEFGNFAQLPAPNFEKIDLILFINQALHLYQNNSSATIEFKSALPQAIINADKDQLLRVLNNLVNNAVQSVDENQSGKILVTVYLEGKMFVVSVKDNGIGIKEDAKQKIFQPNFSTKSYGTGLGLAMCKRIIEQHNGHIWFESRVGEGSAFYFSISKK